MWAVFKKELQSYFKSLTGYMFMGFFLLVSGILFTIINLYPANPLYNNVLQTITFIFLLVVPILTMRLMAEETKQKTDQLLLTSPLPITSIILGKYLAALAVFLLTLIVTIIYPIILSSMGEIFVPQIIGGYVGFFLLGASLISVGLFVSTLTENQVIAAVVSFCTLLAIWILDSLIPGLPKERVAGVIFAVFLAIIVALIVYFTTKSWLAALGAFIVGGAAVGIGYLVKPEIYDGFISKVLTWFSLLARYQDFNLGILSLGPIVYYITFSAAFVFLSIRMIEKRRWS